MLDAEEFLMTALAEAEGGLQSCISCGSQNLREESRKQEVPFGASGEFYFVDVPTIICIQCGASFTDNRAEKIRKEALYEHLGLLKPQEIKTIRTNLGLSRKDFDRAYGLPPASMERWENGRVVQNRSMDTLLRALSNPATAARLDRRVISSTVTSVGNVIVGRFTALEAKPNGMRDAKRKAAEFKLRMGC